MLLEQRPELMLRLGRNRRGDPFGINEFAQRFRLRQRVTLAAENDAGVVEQFLGDQPIRQALGWRTDVTVDRTVVHLGRNGRKDGVDDVEVHVRIADAKWAQRVRQQRHVRHHRKHNAHAAVSHPA